MTAALAVMGWLGWLGWLAAAGVPGAPACFPAPAAGGPGVVDPFRAAAPRAAALNADAKAPYRRGEWDEARRMADEFLARVEGGEAHYAAWQVWFARDRKSVV